MRFVGRAYLVSALFAISAGGAAAEGEQVADLRNELDLLKEEYVARITELEQRLAVAEQNALDANRQAVMAASSAQTGSSSRATTRNSGQAAFNPAIGVIFQGRAWHYRNDPENYEVQGFPLGGETGLAPAGISLAETEIDISANVDDKFTAWLTMPIVMEDGEIAVELEEAWVETLKLPAGLSARFGRFFSGIGYLNEKHAHAWDFADQPLSYQALLGGQYIDDGIQLSWVAPLNTYVEVGAELLRGGRYPAGGASNSGFGSKSVFVNVGGEVGTSHNWLAGISFLDADSVERESSTASSSLLFDGNAQLAIAEFVWKWAPNGNWKRRNLVFQSEYIWRNENGSYTLPNGISPRYDSKQRGWYMQAVYQFFPQWRTGVRIGALSTDATVPAFSGTALAKGDENPHDYSLMLDWSNSEFSRLRLQFMRDESGKNADNRWGLQYILSIGAHGAHSF